MGEGVSGLVTAHQKLLSLCNKGSGWSAGLLENPQQIPHLSQLKLAPAN